MRSDKKVLAPAKKALVLAAHADDGEIGCGGTIARLIEDGWDVQYTPYVLPPNGCLEEVERSSALLGITLADWSIGGPTNRFECRNLSKGRQFILDTMVGVSIPMPDIVFVPNSDDTHQDHEVIRNEAFRAFKETTILGYELPWNNRVFNTDCFFALKKEHLDKKIKAMRQYKSQAHRPYFKNARSFVYSLAQTRGMQIDALYAEAFEVIRWIVH